MKGKQIIHTEFQSPNDECITIWLLFSLLNCLLLLLLLFLYSLHAIIYNKVMHFRSTKRFLTFFFEKNNFNAWTIISPKNHARHVFLFKIYDKMENKNDIQFMNLKKKKDRLPSHRMCIILLLYSMTFVYYTERV